jgi:hypothetical protein
MNGDEPEVFSTTYYAIESPQWFLPSAVLGRFSILARSTYHLSMVYVLGLIAAAAQEFQTSRTYVDPSQAQSTLRTLRCHCGLVSLLLDL